MRADAYGKGINNVRELACGLLMLGLLFGEKASKGDNVSIDLFLGYWSHIAVVLRHFSGRGCTAIRVDMAWKEKGITYAGGAG